MRVLVTGVAGFVGPWLARELAAGGHEVHGFARPEDRSVPDLPAAVTVHRGDVTDRPALTRLLRELSVEGVIHLAAIASLPAADRDPESAYRVNVIGTVSLLAAVRDAVPAARVLVVGSADAYGAVRPTELPVTEDTPFRPMSVYGATKAAADIAATQWARTYGLHVMCARPFNHTGPGQAPTYVCAALAEQIACIERGEQEPVLKVGNADPVRDFSDVRDVVAGYGALLAHGRPGEAYNLCSGEGVSIAEVIALLRTHARLPLRVWSDPARRRPVDVERLVGSHAKITADTGWKPLIPLSDTLRDVLDSFRRTSP